jgi:hypothetical protein
MLTQLPVPMQFSRALFALRQSLTMNGSSTASLATNIRHMCTVVEAVFTDLVSSPLPPENSSRPVAKTESSTHPLPALPLAMNVCLQSLFLAVKRLSEENEVETTRCAVSDIVSLFRNIVHHLHTVASIKFEIATKQRDSIKQSQTSHQQDTPPGSRFHDIGVAMTKVAILALEAVDASTSSHEQILEGFLCVFLDHLGSTLSSIVFPHLHDGRPVADNFTIPVRKNSSGNIDFNQTTEVGIVRQEAGSLVTILRHMLSCVARQHSNANSDKSSLFAAVKVTGTSNNNLAARTRKRLQDTLLRGVFGEHHGSFQDALPRVGVNAASVVIQTSSPSELDPDEWLLGEVWSLLGWDILTKSVEAS